MSSKQLWLRVRKPFQMIALNYIGQILLLCLVKCDAVDKNFRSNCGYSGITEADCRGMGCCYDSTTPDAYLCFHKGTYTLVHMFLILDSAHICMFNLCIPLTNDVRNS